MTDKPQQQSMATPEPVKAPANPVSLPMYKTMMAACIATCTAEVFTIP